MAKKKVKKKAVKKPSYETLQRKIRKLENRKTNVIGDLFPNAYSLFKELHGYEDVEAVNNIIQSSVDQLWPQVRLGIANYETET